MNITILNENGQPFDLGPYLTESSRVVCGYNCLESEAIEGRFVDLNEALSFAVQKLSDFYVARDDTAGDYVVFSNSVAEKLRAMDVYAQ